RAGTARYGERPHAGALRGLRSRTYVLRYAGRSLGCRNARSGLIGGLVVDGQHRRVLYPASGRMTLRGAVLRAWRPAAGDRSARYALDASSTAELAPMATRNGSLRASNRW